MPLPNYINPLVTKTFLPDPANQMCAITLLDSSIPGIEFDADGVSNIARHALWQLKNEAFEGESAQSSLKALIAKITSSKQRSSYDCLIGLSGGVDSSYVALKVRELGLNPLAVHIDNGWNSEMAVNNIERIVKSLEIDLITHVIDWSEFRDLQRAYFKASVLDLECASDHAIVSVLLGTAAEHRIKWIIQGSNVASESIMPSAWAYDKRDGRNLQAIHRKFGQLPLRTYPLMGPSRLFWYFFGRGLRFTPILNYLKYNKQIALGELEQQLGWRPYRRKHGENRFTRFFQEYYLPTKFGIDKRRAHLSSLILNGEITRSEGLELLQLPLYTEDDLRDEFEFIASKLEFKPEELGRLISAPPRKHTEFPNTAWMFNHNSLPVQFARYFAKGEFRISNWRQLLAARRA
jgi:N-acetyl sugar amidotransferase